MQSVPVNDLLNYLPHRGPAIWIDEVVDLCPKGGTCRVEIKKESRFVNEHRFLESAPMEWVAQAYGYICALQMVKEMRPVKKAQKAYLAAIKDFQWLVTSLRPHLGQSFLVKVEETHQVGPIVLVKGEVYFEEKLMAKMQLKLFSQE